MTLCAMTVKTTTSEKNKTQKTQLGKSDYLKGTRENIPPTPKKEKRKQIFNSGQTLTRCNCENLRGG